MTNNGVPCTPVAMRLILILASVTAALAEGQTNSIKSIYKSVFGDDYEEWLEWNSSINTAHQVSIRRGDSHICSGSIISTNEVITAAKCLQNVTTDSMKLISGSVYLDPDIGTLHNVTRSVPHPKFDPVTMDYDVAILQVEPDFVYSRTVLPIQMAEKDDELKPGTMVRVSGWGRTQDEEDSYPDILNYVDLPVVDWSECSAYYKGGITKRMICAGFKEGEKGPCKGDEGGPMMANMKLYGIISWGNGCAKANFPWLYTKVSAVRPFIDAESHGIKPAEVSVAIV